MPVSYTHLTVTESQEESDVILINSCTVTATSDQKVRQVLRRARRKAPAAVIVLTGCMTQALSLIHIS